ncbi:MAG: hypothetical protein WCT49_04240 [Candidatus Paceibacterota bacterium]|jgi:hypothetical protein|nr:hypothetical protein [Candidatus Paceibacterota bacterium]
MIKTTKKLETFAVEIIRQMPKDRSFDEKIEGTKALFYVTDQMPERTIFSTFLFEGKEYYIYAK